MATFVVASDQLVLERQAKSLPLIPIGEDEFYAEVSQTYRLPVAFIHSADEVITHTLIGGEPYHALALDLSVQPDVQLWQSFVGLYKDPSNSSLDEMFRVRLQDGTLFVAGGTHEAPLKAASSRSFLSDLGFYEFEDTQIDQVKILKWGKAVRYYPVDRQLYDAKRIVSYLVNVPVLAPRVS